MSSMIDDLPASESNPMLWGRRISTAALAIFVAVGALGFLGDTSRTATANAQGFTLALTYPTSSRAGQDVPWQLDISSTEPLPPEITVAVSGDYFKIFEQQGLNPEAKKQTADDEFEYWTFHTSGSKNMSIGVDHYVEAGTLRGASGTVGLQVSGELIAPIEFTTHILP